jgi:hypothetical protein
MLQHGADDSAVLGRPESALVWSRRRRAASRPTGAPSSSVSGRHNRR